MSQNLPKKNQKKNIVVIIQIFLLTICTIFKVFSSLLEDVFRPTTTPIATRTTTTPSAIKTILLLLDSPFYK